jgi:predicted lipid-binding transport protein (Tim44 family)
MVRLDREPFASDYVESGSNTQPQPAEEIWTFIRASGGHWLLSAIQQVR